MANILEYEPIERCPFCGESAILSDVEFEYGYTPIHADIILARLATLADSPS